jgi:hypothetical protein
MDIADLDDYEEGIETNKTSIEENLKQFDKLSAIEKSQNLKAMKKGLQEMTDNAKAYKQKIFEISMPKAQEKNLLDKHQEYLTLISQLQEQIKQKEQVLLAGSKEEDEDDDLIYKNGKIDYNKNTSQQVVKHGLKTQEKSKNVALRLEGRVEEMKDMGQKQIEELDRQEDVILRINDANQEIESDLKRAQKYLKYFARTYMQDK